MMYFRLLLGLDCELLWADTRLADLLPPAQAYNSLFSLTALSRHTFTNLHKTQTKLKPSKYRHTAANLHNFSRIFKMKTQAIISLLTSMAALASSTPLPSFDVSTLQLDKKATKSVYICTDSNFGGACQNLVSNSGECSELLSSRPLQLRSDLSVKGDTLREPW